MYLPTITQRHTQPSYRLHARACAVSLSVAWSTRRSCR